MATDRVLSSVEKDRAEQESEFAAEHGPDWREPFAPGTFGGHELLDRLGLVSKLVDDAIVSHPACVQNPEWYALARRASEALADLYQQVGAEQL